ncbi:hypothetical protein AJ87_11090 [Rhizobium yanglingense]|nr:hypothetical protein AJ87_11090 [Rhizobium yanglingense]
MVRSLVVGQERGNALAVNPPISAARGDTALARSHAISRKSRAQQGDVALGIRSARRLQR